MTDTVLVRQSSGEVLKISGNGQNFDPGRPDWATFFMQLTDPPFPDGKTTRDPAGDLRVLGFQKHWDSVNVRNATQVEIDGYQALEDADTTLMDKAGAIALIDTHPIFRKAFKAVAAALEEIRPAGQRRDKGQLVADAVARVSKDD